MRVGDLGVDFQGRFRSRGGGRRILVRERARDANVRRRPVCRLLEHLLKGLQRFRQVEGLEEEPPQAISIDGSALRAAAR